MLTGSTRLDRIGSYMAAEGMNVSPMMLMAVGLLLVGFAFKVSAVPFHMWTPDAYEGAPTVVTGFMSTGVKAAAFAAFARVFLSALEPLRADWTPVLWVLAILTMVLGTVVGVAQSNLKRMLAYSSIAHGGYLLVALVAGQRGGEGGYPLLPGRVRGRRTSALSASSRCLARRTARTTSCATTPACGSRARRWPR